jgi:diguanylate cyclase
MPPEARATETVDLGPSDILAAIDAAIAEQGRWTTRWHRALVCGLPPDPDIVDPNSEDLTDFGRWHMAHADDPLLAQSAFRELWESFRAMHAEAREVAILAIGGPVPPENYDAAVTLADDFLERSRRIRDAFRKAVSDLDPLTGLSNRATMTAELAAEHERAMRTGAPCCLALADIDHFKQVNDTHGHAVGDQVLAAAAGRFLSRLRPYDLIYRYGGEEFLICLPNTDVETARRVLNRLREALCERPIPLPNGSTLPVAASFGFAKIDGSGPVKDTIERADAALYEAKRNGRNRVEGPMALAEDGVGDGG